MSYNVYTTKGLVLSARPIKEADRMYSILTRDLGLIYAHALGVRKEISKLRPGLEPVSLSYVSLIKGKRQWRLTSASLLASGLQIQRNKKKISAAILKAFLLLEKLVQGEEKHPELYDAVEDIFMFANSDLIKNEYAEPLEIILVARMLYHLGYLGEKDVLKGVIIGKPSLELMDEIVLNKRQILEVINSSLRTTDLV